MKFLPDEEQLEALAAQAEATAADSTPAPSEVKSRLYSALLRLQEESGPLLSLAASKAAGNELCVFENLVQVAPLGAAPKSFNCCSVCHARLLAERFSNAPIFWDGCPYVAFQNR
jgi:hypothetical protein